MGGKKYPKEKQMDYSQLHQKLKVALSEELLVLREEEKVSIKNLRDKVSVANEELTFSDEEQELINIIFMLVD